MLPPLPPRQTPAERELLGLFRSLDEEGQRQLQDFAAFLVSRRDGAKTASSAAVPQWNTFPEPRDIVRPDGESVVAAMRRLSETYFMIGKDVLLHDAADLMSEHVMQGRPATEVIDDLERLFEQTYKKMRADVAE